MSRLLTVLLFAGLAFAQVSNAADSESKADIHAKVWSQYTYDLTSGSAHKNGFDLYRTYLQAGYKFDDMWSGSLLLDGQRGETATGTTGAITKANDWAYLRNAYVQAQGLWEGNGTFRFGLQPTLYIPYIEGVAGTRWLTKTLIDEVGILPSQQLGVSATGNWNDMIFYGLMIDNGTEGFTAAGASDSALALDARVTFMPMAHGDIDMIKKLGLTVYDSYLTGGKSAVTTVTTNGQNVVAIALHNQHECMDWAIEWASDKTNAPAKTYTGYGIQGNFKFADQHRASVFARYYSGTDDFKTSKLAAKSSLLFGPTYAFVKDKVMTAVLYQTKANLVDGGNASNSFQWNWAFNF